MGVDKSLLDKVIEVVDKNIRPSLNMDGGDIEIISLNGNILSVRLSGACHGCPRSQETLKYGIERTIKQLVSEDIIVVPV